MQRVTPSKPYECLTPDRLRAIESGIQSFNQDYPSILEGRRHLYDAMTAWEKAMALRPWLVRHVLEALSGDGDIVERGIHNMVCIQFDDSHVANIFRLRELIDVDGIAGNAPFREPKVIRQARTESLQSYLMPPTSDEEEVELPLSDLHIISIGYYVRRAEVVELYFIDQDMTQVREVRALGLLDGVPAAKEDFYISDPTPDFELKDSEDIEEAE